MDSKSSGLGRWMAWGVAIAALVGLLRNDFQPWQGGGIGYNLGEILAAVVVGSFFGAVIWSVRRWVGRKPAIKL